MRKQFVVTIETDKVEQLYPNYRFNYDSEEQFINSVAANIQSTCLDLDGKPSFGYRVDVSPLESK